MTRQKLDELLDKSYEKFPSEYLIYRFSNHLSQGLIALHRIGASDEELQSFFDNYTAKLKNDKVIPSQGLVNKNNYKEFIGKETNYLDLFDFFMSELKEKGTTNTLNEYSDILSPGLCGAAFHGLIRLGYGVDLGTDELIAEGLAYLSFVYFKTLDLGSHEIPIEDFDLTYIAKSLGTIHHSSHLQQVYKLPTYQGLSFQKKLSVIFPSIQKSPHIKELKPFFERFPSRVSKDQASLIIHRMVLGSMALFGETSAKDFFLLHTVSASRCVQVLLNEIQSDEVRSKLLSYLWVGLLLTYVNQGMPSLSNLSSSLKSLSNETLERTEIESRWDRVVKMARKGKEEHIIKMVYSLQDEEKRWGTFLNDQQQCPKTFFIRIAEKMIEKSGLNGEHFIFGGEGFYLSSSSSSSSSNSDDIHFLKDLQSNL